MIPWEMILWIASAGVLLLILHRSAVDAENKKRARAVEQKFKASRGPIAIGPNAPGFGTQCSRCCTTFLYRHTDTFMVHPPDSGAGIPMIVACPTCGYWNQHAMGPCGVYVPESENTQ